MHTDGDWAVSKTDPTVIVEAGTETAIAIMATRDGKPLDESPANARFIVHACNAYYDLVAACKAARNLLSDWPGPVQRILDAAIKKAEEPQ